MSIEDLNGANADFGMALQVKPDHEASLKNKAITSLQLNKFDEAVKDYTNLIKKDSKNQDYYHNRGLAYLQLKDFPSAVDDFTAAIEIKKEFAEAYFNRANAYSKMERYTDACDDIKSAEKYGYAEATALINSVCN